jgi:hypothetical protein
MSKNFILFTLNFGWRKVLVKMWIKNLTKTYHHIKFTSSTVSTIASECFPNTKALQLVGTRLFSRCHPKFMNMVLKRLPSNSEWYDNKSVQYFLLKDFFYCENFTQVQSETILICDFTQISLVNIQRQQ